ncbi:hypothetical protein BDQ17DRAFT_1435910 [Cyathus striatus]|nr:hypothetical protein BDQ17DRAFT_1435910 [Cyathus striatus]
MEREPFMAPYGKKNAAWVEVNEYLVKNGFPRISSELLRQKVEGLVGYHKNPKSLDSKAKLIAGILSGTSDNITIAALLDRIVKQWDDSQQLSEDKKVELKKKHDDDRLGGEALWQASLSGLYKKHKYNEIFEDTATDTNSVSSPSASGTISTESSLTSIDDDDDDVNDEDTGTNPSKRRCKMKCRSRVSVDEDAAACKDYMERSDKRQDKLINILEGFLEIQKQQATKNN